jgi:hypothetical protein
VRFERLFLASEARRKSTSRSIGESHHFRQKKNHPDPCRGGFFVLNYFGLGVGFGFGGVVGLVSSVSIFI